MYVENYATRSEAMKRELEIKAKKSRKYIEKLIKSGERPDTTES
jgi:predicted GIY-YIG superfamily endonuclease